MCGRITLVNLTWPELMDWLTLSAIPDEPVPESFNRPPTTTIPIIRQGASGAEGAMARWGVVPEWFKGSLREWRASTINARVEEVARKPSFRDAYRRAGPEKLDKGLRCVPPSIGGTEYGEASPFYG